MTGYVSTVEGTEELEDVGEVAELDTDGTRPFDCMGSLLQC